MRKLIINYENEQKDVEISEELKLLLKNIIQCVLDTEKFYFDTKVDMLFVDNATIRELNLKHRNVDKVTDVLSFPILDINPNDGYNISISVEDYDYETQAYLLGDIVISLDKVIEQSKEYGHSFERELGFLTAHSVFHLLGYDHITKNEEKEMYDKTEEVMNLMNLKR